MSDDPAPTPMPRPPRPPEAAGDRRHHEGEDAGPSGSGVHEWRVQTNAPAYTTVTVRSLDGIRFEVLDRALDIEKLHRCGSAFRLLRTLLKRLDESVFNRWQVLECELTVPDLEALTGLGRSAIYAAAARLVEERLIAKAPGTGHRSSRYRIRMPDDADGESLLRRTGGADVAPPAEPAGDATQRQRAPYDGGDRPQGEGLPLSASADNDPEQSAEARAGRALPRTMRHPEGPGTEPPVRGSEPQARASADCSDPNCPPERAPGARSGGLADPALLQDACAGAGAPAPGISAAAASRSRAEAEAAAAEVRQLRLNRRLTEELAALPTTTPLVVVAARLEAGKRVGLMIALIRDPDRLTPKFLDQAARVLAARPGARPPAPPRSADPDAPPPPPWASRLELPATRAVDARLVREINTLDRGVTLDALVDAVIADDPDPERRRAWRDLGPAGSPSLVAALAHRWRQQHPNQPGPAVPPPRPQPKEAHDGQQAHPRPGSR